VAPEVSGARYLFEFLAHTGLRISEATGLRWEHVDLGERPRVRVREQHYKGERKRLKSGAGRRNVPLSPRMASKLITHRRGTTTAARARPSSRVEAVASYTRRTSPAMS
jgi:integrase